MVLVGVLLSGCSNDTAEQGIQSVRLPPCSAEGSVFAEQPYKEWKNLYHTNVSKVVQAHLDTINNVTALPLQCTAENYADLQAASTELLAVANMLPMWRENGRAARLREADMGAVLLEFLRVYECSLNERNSFLTLRVTEEATGAMNYGELATETEKARQEIETELRVSRPAMERTLGLVGGYDRLRPLALDIECIKRASLDLRNVMGLAADASACLPRAWDAKGSLRDLAP